MRQSAGRTTTLRAAVLAVALLALAGCSSSDDAQPADDAESTTTRDRDAGAGDGTPTRLRTEGATYVVPDPLPAGEPGDLLAATTEEPSEHLAGAERTQLLYLSEDTQGDPVAVSGVLLVPQGDAPEGGWPLISWGHGTTGVADVCAPSRTDNLFYNEYAQEASSYLDAGYAVVATDYPGLGTPGGHAYLSGVDEGNAMVDAVRAARHLDPSIGSTWWAVGHSQGGQAALFATRSAERAPELELGGAVAIAPASGLELALPAILAGGVPADLVYGTYVIAGLAAMDPTVELADELGPAGLEHLELLTEQGCLLDALPELEIDELDEIFDLSPERAIDLSARVAAYGNPENEATVGPVVVMQGEEDHDIPLGLSQQLVRRLQDKGADVELRTYPGLNHDTVLGPSICDRLAWLAAHGGPAADGCVPYETDLS